MGMYDSVRIEKGIKIPSVEKLLPGLENFDIHEIEFQTKDLDCNMYEYTVKSDGGLYLTEVYRDSMCRFQPYTGNLYLYHLDVSHSEYHCTSELLLKFKLGTLVDAVLLEFTCKLNHFSNLRE